MTQQTIFYEGWEAPPWEMQSRFDCIKAAIDQIDFDGKTVLDLASGVGYYSYMATQRGAKHVHLCDKDEGTMQYARMKMTDKGVQDKCSFIFGNVFDLLDVVTARIDVVFMNGLLYHTPRQHELLERIRGMNPEVVLMETLLLDSPYIAVSYWPDYDLHVPTQRFVEILLADVGFMSWQWQTSAPHRALYTLR